MPSLQRIRRRLPLPVFVLLLVVLVVMVGFVCLCMTDHPAQVIERALAAMPLAPALLGLWSFAAAVLAVTTFTLVHARRPRARPSPAALQRFLF